MTSPDFLLDVARLPKADLHIHAETSPRLERMVARQEGRVPYDWQAERDHLTTMVPAGVARLEMLSGRFPAAQFEPLDLVPENQVQRIVDLLIEEALAGAILVEVRFGRDTILRPDFMDTFREAERRVQSEFPALRAGAIITTYPHGGREDILDACLAAARDGLAGIDFIPTPYHTEADWTPIYRWAKRAREAGLGITAHAGEFSTANIAAALRVPGLSRLGHATYAASDPQLLEALANSRVTVECCLTCNVALGAISTYDDHPIRKFVDLGIPVTLNTDDPVRVVTTIDKEYAVTASLGFSGDDLLRFTRNAMSASFLPPHFPA